MLRLFQGFRKYEEEFDPHSMVLYCVTLVVTIGTNYKMLRCGLLNMLLWYLVTLLLFIQKNKLIGNMTTYFMITLYSFNTSLSI